MIRNYSDDGWTQEELKRLNAAQWQIDALKRNPAYNLWGVHEDYMISGQGWGKPEIYPDWLAYSGFKVDDLNEIVNFYFAIERDHIECPSCGGHGYNPPTSEISQTFYDFEHTGKRWVDKITDDEVQALWNKGRLSRFKERPTAAQVNAASSQHDAINRLILIETRAKRLGVYGQCPECEGHGEIFTSPTSRLTLNLWVIHPRKSASRGVEIESITESDMPAVLTLLRAARDRNAERFGKLD